jgi:hypothetical protein
MGMEKYKKTHQEDNTFSSRITFPVPVQYSRPASFADLRIAVLLIGGKIIVVIFVHLGGVGPSLLDRRSD